VGEAAAPEAERAEPASAAVEERPAPKAEAPAEPAPEEAAGEAPGSNGYSAAERQARSLAEAVRDRPAPQPEPEPERTVVHSPAAEDGRPAVPNRRRGLMRRLFTK
jgi:hypothetical protein